MSSLVRLTTGINKCNISNAVDNYEEIDDLLNNLPHQGSDIVMLPRWAFTGPECGGLASNSVVTSGAALALDKLLAATAQSSSYYILGTVTKEWGEVVPKIMVLNKGEIISQLICSDTSVGDFSEKNVFSCGSMRFGVLTGSAHTITNQVVSAATYGCDLLLLPIYSPVYAGMIDEISKTVKQLSSALGISIAVVNGGLGGSSFPYFYQGFSLVYECGELLGSISAFDQNISLTVDLDTEIIAALKQNTCSTVPSHGIPLVFPKPNLLRAISKMPFLPKDNPDDYLEELFSFQARSLATRMQNTGINKLLLGISGGLDSTMALLVSVAACHYLELPLTNIIGITLPGLGTSDQTYFNALSLMEQLGINSRDISIKPAVQQHFLDIGHLGDLDTTYENAQARERTQVLLDIANMEGGLVVGSGDLSEEALGFSTFGGDHLANYNVNACLTKTVLRELLGYLIKTDVFPEISDILGQILDTPVSPELLPTTETGEIKQKTEDILGPYILHDFFLYYFVRYSMRPSKIYHYACIAFSDSMRASFVKEKLELFIRKFCTAQFKRSCAPDAASITEVNLLGVVFTMPSDLDSTALLADLNNI